MEAILSLLALNGTWESLPFSEEIQPLVEDYFKGKAGVTLLSDQLEAWESMKFPFTMTMLPLASNEASKVTAAGFIVDAEDNWTSGLIKGLSWNLKTKFIVITNETNQEIVAQDLINTGICHSIVITMMSDGFEVHNVSEPCKGIGFIPPNGYNCSATVSLVEIPPHVLIEGDEIGGFESIMIQAVANHLGITLDYLHHDAAGWGHFEPPTGMEGDLALGKALCAIGSLYPFVERTVKLEITVISDPVKIAFVVPDKAGPAHPTWFIILVSELSPLVWLCTFGTFLVFTFLSMLLFEKSENEIDWPIHNFALIIGMPQKILQSRLFALTALFFGFLVTSYYRSIMSSKLTIPSKIPEITTLEELVQSGLVITGPINVKTIVTDVADGDKIIAELGEKIQVVKLEIPDALLNVAQDRKTAFGRHHQGPTYYARKDIRIGNHVHFVEEFPIVFYPMLLFQKNSCLFERFSLLVHRLMDTGLSAKWISDAVGSEKKEDPDGPKKLAMEHIYGFLYLLFIGWIVSAAVFVAEMGYFYSSFFVNRRFPAKVIPFRKPKAAGKRNKI